MVGDWRTVRIDQLADMASGKGLPKSRYNESGEFPVLGSNGLLGWCDEPLYRDPVITIGRVGACGEIHKTDGPAWVSDNALVTTPKDGCDFLFLYYLLKSIDFTAIIGGTTQPLITQTAVKNLQVKVPSLIEQQAIACILGALDDRIELNLSVNRMLEAMTRAIFKSWFVDFDPVRTRAEGHQPRGLNAVTTALFPGYLIDSELGKVPQGWRVVPFSEILTPSVSRVGDAILPEYSATVTGLFPREDRFKKQLSRSQSKNKKIESGDLVFGLSRQVINFGLMRDKEGAVSPVYEIFKIDTEQIDPDLLEQSFRINMHFYLDILRPGAREGQPIDREYFLTKPTLIPDRKVQCRFRDLATPLTEKMKALGRETRTLTAISDTLLPMLISGELRVPDAERIVARAV